MNDDEMPLDTVTGTLESMTLDASIMVIRLAGDTMVYLMPREIVATLHRKPSHYEAVMRAEFVSQENGPDDEKPLDLQIEVDLLRRTIRDFADAILMLDKSDTTSVAQKWSETVSAAQELHDRYIPKET